MTEDAAWNAIQQGRQVRNLTTRFERSFELCRQGKPVRTLSGVSPEEAVDHLVNDGDEIRALADPEGIKVIRLPTGDFTAEDAVPCTPPVKVRIDKMGNISAGDE